jgi:hypothetical protein
LLSPLEVRFRQNVWESGTQNPTEKRVTFWGALNRRLSVDFRRSQRRSDNPEYQPQILEFECPRVCRQFEMTRGDWTPFELFLRGIAAWDTALRERLDAGSPLES